jgi:hypothetical protein
MVLDTCEALALFVSQPNNNNNNKKNCLPSSQMQSLLFASVAAFVQQLRGDVEFEALIIDLTQATTTTTTTTTTVN